LATLYPDEASWNADRARVLGGIAAAPKLVGRAGRSAQALADVLDAVHELRGRAGKMARFAVLENELDPTSPDHRARYDAATALEGRVEEAVAFLARDVRTIGATRLARWQVAEPRLAPHRWRLHQLQSQTSLPEMEKLLASFARWPQTTGDAAEQLLEADLGWNRIALSEIDGAVVDRQNFELLRRDPNAGIRHAATQAYFGRLRVFEPLFGLLATRRIEADLAVARFRGAAYFIDGELARNDHLP